jgi:PAS domain S-box-containing protein
MKYQFSDVKIADKIGRYVLPDKGILRQKQKEKVHMKNTGITLKAEIQKTIQKQELSLAKLKRENEELKKSVTNFSCVFDQSPVGSAIIGTDKHFIRCNLAFCNFLGYSENELTGKTISFITYPEDIEKGMNDLIDKKIKSFIVQKRFQRKDSKLVWGEMNICLVCDALNRPLYFLPIIQDIDKQKKAEIKLIESEERYKRITEGLTDYMYTVIIKNGKAIKTLHNEACIAITGYSPKEFNKDPYLWINMVIQEEREFVADRFSNILTGDYKSTIEHRIIRKDGKIRWISDTAIPKYDSNGILVSYDGVIRDITKIKLFEKYAEINSEIINLLNEPGDITLIRKHAELKLIEIKEEFNN